MQSMRPLDPIFDTKKRMGALAIGNTPSFGTTVGVTINKASGQADPAFGGDVIYDVVFAESVTGFATGDVSTSGSTTPGTLVGTVAGSGATYTVTVSGMTGGGLLVASINAGVCVNTSGLPNGNSTSTDNIVQYYMPSIGGFAYSPGTTSNPATPAYPGIIAAGDIAVIFAGNSGGGGPSWITPTGYTLVGTGSRGVVFTKVCAGTETGTTVSVSAPGNVVTAIILIMSAGGVTSATANAFATAGAVSGATIPYPTVTPSVNPTYVFYTGHGISLAGSPVNPGGSNPTPAVLAISSLIHVNTPRLAVFGGRCTSTSALGARNQSSTGFTNFMHGMATVFPST